jgi:hypothetical protein
MAAVPSSSRVEIPDDDADSASDWEATAQDANDFSSVAGSESIASLSTDEDTEEDNVEEPSPEPKKQLKPLKSAKAKAKAAQKPAAESPRPPATTEKAKKKPKKKIAPAIVAPKKTQAAVKIIKYTASNATGAAGRPLKNATAVVPEGFTPSEYPSVKAYRENPPTTAEQYLRVDVAGRKHVSYRAFHVKSLQPPHNSTYYVLANKTDDEAALKQLGVAVTPALAKLAQAQHKKDLGGVQDAAQQVTPDTLKALGWPLETPDGLNMLPPIMSSELSDAPSKKRPAEEEPAAAPTVTKRLCNELEKALGGTVTSFTFTVKCDGSNI